VLEDTVDGQEVRRVSEAGCRSIATPPVVGWAHRDAGANGVEHDVAADVQQMLVVLDQDRPVPALEDMPTAVVPIVEMARIETVELPHRDRQVGTRRLDDQVVVVPEQAVRVTAPAVAVDRPR
jgi:hypothetical protein